MQKTSSQWVFLAIGAMMSVGAVPREARAQTGDEVAKTLAQGDLFASRHKYQLALDAYHKADKLARHNSAECFLKLASVERKTGDFSAALDDNKRAIKLSGESKAVAIPAHQQRAALLALMAGKPTDKKLREAEAELREALALDTGDALTHFNLGVVLLKQGRDSEGTAELKTAMASNRLDRELMSEAEKYVASPIMAREPFAPDFDFVTKEDQRMSNASLRGKVVLMDFWGSWCGPCRESVPILKNVRKKYAGKAFQLVGVSSDDDEDVWRTFIEAQKMDWAEYIDLSENVLTAFRIESFPTYIVLDKDGVIRFRQSGLGEETQGDLEDAINKALKRESNPELAAAAARAATISSPPPAIKNSAPAGAADKSTAARAESGPAGGEGGKPAATIEGEVAGNIYRNELLGMNYELPANWIAAGPETLRALNGKTEAAAKAAILQQHPEMADRITFVTPRIVLYASRRGEGDGQKLIPPCMRITAYPTRLDSLRLNIFEQTVEQMARAQDLKVTSPAAEFTVNGHDFLRVDFERSAGGRHFYEAYVQSVAGDYLLTIEFYATTAEELERSAASLKSMTIKDTEE